MKTDGQRRARLGGSLLVVGLALGAVGLARRQTAHAPPPDLDAPARELRQRVDAAAAAAAERLQPEIAKAASVPALGAAWKMGADRVTYQDLLENEDWWAPYRARFAITGVALSTGTAAALGAPATDVSESDVVHRAREGGAATGLLARSTGGVFLAAAGRLKLPASASHAAPAAVPVIFVATPLDEAALLAVAGQAGDELGLSNGSAVLAATGPEPSRRLVASLVGREQAGPVSLEGGRVGLAWPLGSRAWMLAVSQPGTLAALPPPTSGLWLIVGGAAFALAGAVALTSRRRPEPEVSSPAGSRAAPATPVGRPSPPTARTADAGAGPSPVTPAPAAAPGTQAWGLRPTEAASATAVPAPTGAASAALKPAELREMGRYRLIERIGEGGMAEIFFAAAHGAEDFVRHFVLKRMHPHLARHREVVNQFIDEARLQAGLVHSNIVPVFDFGTTGDEYYLALEYIHGRDLGQIVQQHVAKLGRPLDVPVAFYILHEVLDALAFAHSQRGKDGAPLDIVHRDVAPGNVLVSYRGEVKLTDFGIAKAEKRVSRTEVGMVKGNASFMSPEQARGESVDLRSDIFSAGLVLYYCLTGNFLYAGENTLNQLLRAAVGPVTSQFSAIGDLPVEAAEILRRALAQDLSTRYESAVEFERDVSAAMGKREDLARVMDVLFPTSDRRDLRLNRLESG